MSEMYGPVLVLLHDALLSATSERPMSVPLSMQSAYEFSATSERLADWFSNVRSVLTNSDPITYDSRLVTEYAPVSERFVWIQYGSDWVPVPPNDCSGEPAVNLVPSWSTTKTAVPMAP